MDGASSSSVCFRGAEIKVVQMILSNLLPFESTYETYFLIHNLAAVKLWSSRSSWLFSSIHRETDTRKMMGKDAEHEFTSNKIISLGCLVYQCGASTVL